MLMLLRYDIMISRVLRFHATRLPCVAMLRRYDLLPRRYFRFFVTPLLHMLLLRADAIAVAAIILFLLLRHYVFHAICLPALIFTYARYF